MMPTEIKNSSSVEMLNKVNGSLATVAADFVNIICIELNMLMIC